MTWTPQVEQRVSAALREAARPQPAADDVQQRVDVVLAGHRRRRRRAGVGVLAVVALAGGLVGQAVYESVERDAGGRAVASLSAQASRSAQAERSRRAEARASEAAEVGADPGAALRRLAESLPRGADVHLEPRLQAGDDAAWSLVQPGGRVVALPDVSQPWSGGGPAQAILTLPDATLVRYSTADGSAGLARVTADAPAARVEVHAAMPHAGVPRDLEVDQTGASAGVVSQDADTSWRLSVVDVTTSRARLRSTAALTAPAGRRVEGVSVMAVVGNRAIAQVQYATQEGPGATDPASGLEIETRTVVLGPQGTVTPLGHDVILGEPGRLSVSTERCTKAVAPAQVLDDAAIRRAPCQPVGLLASATVPSGGLRYDVIVPSVEVTDVGGRQVTTTRGAPPATRGPRTLDLSAGAPSGEIATLAVHDGAGATRCTVLLAQTQLVQQPVWEGPASLLLVGGMGGGVRDVVRIDVDACSAARAPLPDGVQSIAW